MKLFGNRAPPCGDTEAQVTNPKWWREKVQNAPQVIMGEVQTKMPHPFSFSSFLFMLPFLEQLYLE